MLRCQNMRSRTWMSAASSSRRDIAINRNIKARGITRSLCGMPHRLKIRLNIPLNLMHTTRHFLSRIRTQSAGQKLCADIPVPLLRGWRPPQKERRLSNKQLADRSLVGEKTIQRLRSDEEYPTSVQTVLALCVGLKLPLP